jgi:hypothetical protein
VNNRKIIEYALMFAVPFSVLWPYFFEFAKIANIENTAYILFPLIKYSEQLLQGGVPYWSFSSGIGAPWPIPFGMTHTPFVLLYNFLPPMFVMGITLMGHGMLAYWAIVRVAQHLQLNRIFQVICGVTFFYTGAVEYLFWADAPEIFLIWCIFPVMFLCLITLLKETDRRLSLVWAITLGYIVGYGALNGHIGIFSFYVAAIAVTYLFVPFGRVRALPYLALAFIVFLIVSLDKMYFLFNEAALFSDFIERQHSEGQSLAYIFWNLLLKPFPIAIGIEISGDWRDRLVDLYSHSRTVGFGAILFIFALVVTIQAIYGKVSPKVYPYLTPIIAGFFVSTAFTFLPDNSLPDAISTFIAFRDPANFFGILLGCFGMQRFFETRWNGNGSLIVRLYATLILLHLGQVIAAAQPFIVGPFVYSQPTFHSMGELNRLVENPESFPVLEVLKNASDTEEIRVVLTGNAVLQARLNRFNFEGLVTNFGFLAGVSEVSAILKGISLDSIHPSQSKPYGSITGEDLVAWQLESEVGGWPTHDQTMLSLLNIDYVIDVDGPVPQAPYLEKVESFSNDFGEISIYRNNLVWQGGVELPEGFLDQTIENKWPCREIHLTCLDLGSIGFAEGVLDSEIEIEFIEDRIVVSMFTKPFAREFLLSTMFRPDWAIAAGYEGRIENWNGMVRLFVPSGTDSLTIEYLPTIQKFARYTTWIFLAFFTVLLLYFFSRRRIRNLRFR